MAHGYNAMADVIATTADGVNLDTIWLSPLLAGFGDGWPHRPDQRRARATDHQGGRHHERPLGDTARYSSALADEGF